MNPKTISKLTDLLFYFKKYISLACFISSSGPEFWREKNIQRRNEANRSKEGTLTW